MLRARQQSVRSVVGTGVAPSQLSHAAPSTPLQMLGVLLSFFLVDSLGRRPLLVWGSVGCAAALGALCLADWLALKAFLVAGMCAFIFAFRWEAATRAVAPCISRMVCAACLLLPLHISQYASLCAVLCAHAPSPCLPPPLAPPQRVLGGRVLGAAVRAVQHERQVARRLGRHRRALPDRCVQQLLQGMCLVDRPTVCLLSRVGGCHAPADPIQPASEHPLHPAPPPARPQERWLTRSSCPCTAGSARLPSCCSPAWPPRQGSTWQPSCPRLGARRYKRFNPCWRFEWRLAAGAGGRRHSPATGTACCRQVHP